MGRALRRGAARRVAVAPRPHARRPRVRLLRADSADESRRRRGCRVDSPWRRVTAPPSRHRRGRDGDSPWGRRGAGSSAGWSRIVRRGGAGSSGRASATSEYPRRGRRNSTEYPRRGRGVAASPRRRRECTPAPRVHASAATRAFASSRRRQRGNTGAAARLRLRWQRGAAAPRYPATRARDAVARADPSPSTSPSTSARRTLAFSAPRSSTLTAHQTNLSSYQSATPPRPRPTQSAEAARDGEVHPHGARRASGAPNAL